jgi:hypothetical protein
MAAGGSSSGAVAAAGAEDFAAGTSTKSPAQTLVEAVKTSSRLPGCERPIVGVLIFGE